MKVSSNQTTGGIVISAGGVLLPFRETKSWGWAGSTENARGHRFRDVLVLSGKVKNTGRGRGLCSTKRYWRISVSPTAANSAGFSLSRTEPVLLECSARLPSLYSRAQSDDLASSA